MEDQVFEERNSTRLLACTFDYFLVVCAVVQLLSTTFKKMFVGLHYFYFFYIN
jgi:hypothetical protein